MPPAAASAFSEHPFLQGNQRGIEPLFVHWRHVSSGVGKGWQFDESAQHNADAVFCPYNKEVDVHLCDMHVLQRAGDANVQADIDRYLIMCIGVDFQHLVLPRNNVPHYDNLPDMSACTICILDCSMDARMEMQQVLLLVRQCTPLRRRTKRAQRELQWKPESLAYMQQVLRCIQGTLLGLYRGNKSVAFGVRSAIIRILRSMILLPFAKMNACMRQIRYIIKLSMMEHLCNSMHDYNPGAPFAAPFAQVRAAHAPLAGIYHILNQSAGQMDSFLQSVTTICNIFRGEVNTMYFASAEKEPAQAVLGMLPHMEKLAHSYFERCTRAYRGIIIGETYHNTHHEGARCAHRPLHTGDAWG